MNRIPEHIQKRGAEEVVEKLKGLFAFLAESVSLI